MPLSNHIAAGRRRGENALEGAPGASGGGWGARSASGSRATTRPPRLSKLLGRKAIGWPESASEAADDIGP